MLIYQNKQEQKMKTMDQFEVLFSKQIFLGIKLQATCEEHSELYPLHVEMKNI